MTGIAKNLLGHTYGRATVIARNGTRRRKAYWLCRCSCGTEFSATGGDLRTGNTTSCGCWGRESRSIRSLVHGGATRSGNTGAYRSWQTMRSRCLSPKATNYERYGGRGITVCDRWSSFANFLADMGERPKGFSLERGDPNGNYEPGNCSWLLWADQAKNTRATVWVTLNGERMHQAEAARHLGVNASRLYHWHKIGRVPEGIDLAFDGGSKGEAARREIDALQVENEQLRAAVAIFWAALQLQARTA